MNTEKIFEELKHDVLIPFDHFVDVYGLTDAFSALVLMINATARATGLDPVQLADHLKEYYRDHPDGGFKNE